MASDRHQYDPMPEHEIDDYVRFSVAVMEQAEQDNVLFDLLTEWDDERIVGYEKAYFMWNVAESLRERVMQGDDEPNWFDI